MPSARTIVYLVQSAVGMVNTAVPVVPAAARRASRCP
jgi:hypothetical protein